VILHWLAILIFAMLGIGFFQLEAGPNTDPDKIDILRIHMAVGMPILALMVIRFVVRICTRRPAEATRG
jgi:cytochrome b561